MQRVSETACFGGRMGVWTHRSKVTDTEMRFGLYLPPAAEHGACPALFCLAGLTCSDENFATKAGAQRFAAEAGLALVFPDTCPRGPDVPDADRIDVGQGAGFYLTATEAPWSASYDMANYVAHELPTLIEAEFAVRSDRRGIAGHSMGGHGALVLALREPDRFASVSALAPISNPTVSEWGSAAFSAYLGPDRSTWEQWDASLLIGARPLPTEILVDQGEADPHLDRLRTETLRRAADASGQRLRLRRHPGYDHSYWFVQTFIADHIAHHAAILLA